MSDAASESNSVCVVIAAYNASKTIACAVSSALAQPEVSEIIIVDDASTDDTACQAQSVNDGTNRLKILVQTQNAGPSAARNRAIAESRAAWLSILDADDFFLPGRIAGLLSFSDSVDMVADDLWQVPENNINGPRKSLMGNKFTAPITINFTEFVLSNVTKAGTERKELGFIKPIIRKQFLIDHHLHYQEHMRLGEDFELYTRALILGARLALVPAQGYISVVRANSLSGQHSEMDLQYLRDCTVPMQKEYHLTRQQKYALYQHSLSIDCRLQWRLLINAVKGRNIIKIVSIFFRPITVQIYLAKQLIHQVNNRFLSARKTTHIL